MGKKKCKNGELFKYVFRERANKMLATTELSTYMGPYIVKDDEDPTKLWSIDIIKFNDEAMRCIEFIQNNYDSLISGSKGVYLGRVMFRPGGYFVNPVIEKAAVYREQSFLEIRLTEWLVDRTANAIILKIHRPNSRDITGAGPYVFYTDDQKEIYNGLIRVVEDFCCMTIGDLTQGEFDYV